MLTAIKFYSKKRASRWEDTIINEHPSAERLNSKRTATAI